MTQSFQKKLDGHRSKVQKVIDGQVPVHHIERACGLDDGSLLSLPTDYNPADCRGVVAFIPAAGASSRFLSPFVDLLDSLEKRSGVLEAYHALLTQPGVLPDVVHLLQDASVHSDELYRQVQKVLTGPKALFPCVREGVCFLQMKALEHEAYDFLEGQIFVAPAGTEKDFEGVQTQLPTQIFTQGLDLSTVRCSEEGEFLTENGEYSVVPAGHGALIGLFPKIRETFSGAESIFIRNIDNVTGALPEVIQHTQYFVSFYGKVRDAVLQIRAALNEKRLQDARSLASELMSCAPQEWQPNTEQDLFLQERDYDSLTVLQMKLFHTPLSLLKSTDLKDLYQRPLNVLGQVPKRPEDIGGTPVLTKEGFKLCVELAHVSEQERQAHLSPATHFNPVLVASELTQGISSYEQEHPFWIVAQKQWKGRSVLYYESLLYELLGNSLLANVIFVSVPRELFKPHKAFGETEHQTMQSLGFQKA